MDYYMKISKNDSFIEKEHSKPKSASFEFKSENLNSTEIFEKTKIVHRLNSGNTTTTFKSTFIQDDDELTFGNIALDSVKYQPRTSQKASSSRVEEQEDHTALLLELLEKCGITQKTYPVYKPTPVYPIGHFLSNSCTVSGPGSSLGPEGSDAAQNLRDAAR